MKQEDAIKSPARSLIRATLVVILGVFVLVTAWLNTTVAGDYSFSNDAVVQSDFVVRMVVAGSAAAKAGLQANDRVNFRDLDLRQRLTIMGGRMAHPGELISFTVSRNSVQVPIVIHAVAYPATIYLVLIKRIAATIFIFIAGLLVLLRPNRMLWGFYLFALGSVSASPYIFSWSPTWLLMVTSVLISQIYYVAFLIAGLWIFVSRFPGDVAEDWRAGIDRAAVPAGVALACMGILTIVFAAWATPLPEIVDRLLTLAIEGAVALGILCLFSGFAHLQADKRQRFKWVFAAFMVFLATLAYANISPYLPNSGWPAAWTNAGFAIDVLAGVQVIIPLTVAYAVLKHRVLDVNFVISRALVYALITTMIVGVFATIDWLVSRVLLRRELALAAEFVAAVSFGFGLNSIHNVVDSFVDRTLFRRRHLAERRLRRVAEGLPHARSADAVDKMLVAEPMQAFGLTSAAVFRKRDGTNSFVRAADAGWPAGTADELKGDDPLLIHLHGERGVLRLREIPRTDGYLPSGVAEPILALPLLVRHQLEGVVLFGPHETGEDVDPDETRMLERLATSAAAAYDHIEAEQHRQRAEELAHQLSAAEREISLLKTTLAQSRS